LPKETYRLADSTTVEPLINQWGVWSDLIAPAPYGMHLEHYQIKTVTSYLENPEIHLKACRNPKLIGGPFVDIPAERADEVRALLDSMRGQRANRELAKAITDVYEFLAREAKGQSLEPFYARLPESLRGYTELVYDYYNHPILRLMEGPLALLPCVSETQYRRCADCADARTCELKSLFRVLHDSTVRILDGWTLADARGSGSLPATHLGALPGKRANRRSSVKESSPKKRR